MEIEEWLSSLGLREYTPRFTENDVDFELLPKLTNEDLKELGIESLGHRRKILNAIAVLCVEPVPNPAQRPSPEPTRKGEPSSAAERRQLTVVFCDLVSSTELSARLDPEDLRDVIRTYQQECARCFHDYDGFVAKFMGDGVLAYFGYPVAHEDDAARAVSASLAVISSVGCLPNRSGARLRVRIGVATGLVIVGDLIGEGASQEKAVVGETPNLAARLQSVAEPDTAVVSESTRQLLGSQFDLQPSGPHNLKGFQAAVCAWRVVGENTHVSRFEAHHGERLAPLIGRAHEVALLLDRWRLAAQGDDQVVLLSGEAGIGKSRIAQELRDQIRGEPHLVVRYQCSPHHSNHPFYPAIDQIWHAAGFVADEPAGARLEKLEALVDRSKLPRREALPYLASLLSLSTEGRYPTPDQPPSIVKERTIDALIALLTGLAQSSPVLFLLEDAHWIDPTTMELTSRALDKLQDSRVLSVITFRPDFVPPWVGRANVTALALNRLARPHAISMVDVLTEGKKLPPEVLEQIVRKTDGVPLFVEELTKTVLGSGLLREESGGFVLAKALTPLAIPSTVQDSLMARLDRMAPVKEIAQIGAVIGREFPRSLLQAVAGISEDALEDGLSQLVASGLIYMRGSVKEPSFVFKHALVQDTAYATLLRARREQIHADIARALTEQFSDRADTAPETIALHFTEAGLAEPAVRNWLSAAELALSRSANTEGARYAEKGLELLAKLPPDDDRRKLELALQVARGNAALALKGYTARETIEILHLVKQHLDSGIGTDMQRFSVLYGLWAANYVAGRISPALKLAAEYLEVANRTSDCTYRIIANRISGAALIAAGHHRDGLAHLLLATEEYDPVRHRPLSFRFGQDIGLSALCHQAWALWFLGQTTDADKLVEQILAELPGHGHATTTAFCMLYGGIFPAIFAREFDKVDQLGLDLVRYCEARKMGPNYVSAGRLCSGVAQAIRNPEQANIREIQREMEILHGFGVYILDSPISALLTEVQIAAGDYPGAEATLMTALEFVNETQELYWLAELHRLRGRLAMQPANLDVETAGRCFAEAIRVAHSQEAFCLELRAANDLAEHAKVHPTMSLAGVRLPELLGAVTGDRSVDVRKARALIAAKG